MKRWLLTSLTAVGLSTALFAEDNPFRPGKQPAAPDKTEVKPEEKKADAKKVDVATARIAHIKLGGDLDESPVSSDSLFGPPAENFAMKLARIQKAAKDERIQGLLLDLGDLEAGYGKLHELKAAVSDFKKTGKKVFAYAEEYSPKAYLLAGLADAIGTPEGGGVMLFGMRAEVTFYKNTLEMLRLKADVLKVGDYKAAVEPFLRDGMSKENREQIESMLEDNFTNEMVEPIAKARKMTPEKVRELIDQGPFTAPKALALGLIDAVVYEDEFDDVMAKAIGAKAVKIERGYAKPKAQKLDLSNPFSMMEMLSGGTKKEKESSEPKIAVIYAVGSIVSGKSGEGNPLFGGGGSVGSETIVEAFRKAEKDDTVKAIVLRVDSPGGSALASDVMWREITKSKKPIVASMGDVAASGGYYISMGCKKIYAEPGTITGSIGVFGLKLVTGGLEELVGMKTEVVSRGKNSGVMSSTFPWSDSERKALTETVEAVYDQFTTKAVAGRKAAGVDMTKEKLLKIASGRVWTGRQAKANGLVDELGTLDDAIAGAKKLAGIDPSKKMELMVLPKASSFFEKLLEGEAKMPFGKLDATMLRMPATQKALKMLAPLFATQKDMVKAMMPFHVEFN
jgi:protease IV